MGAHKVRVLHLLESGGLYGAERVVLNLSTALRAAGRYEPVVGCIVQNPDEPSALFDEARRLGFAAEKVLLRNLRLAVDVPREARRLRALGIGLVHSHGYKATVYGGFLRALWPVPMTATCHLWFIEPGSPLKMRLMVGLEMRFYRRFRTVTAVSGEIRQVLVKAGVREDRVRVIPNGIPLDPPLLPAAERERLRASLGVGPEGFLVLNAGRLTAQKDQATLLRAVGGLPATGRPVTCLVAGEGELRESLQSQIVAGGWGDRVRLLGFRDDVPALLQAADAFALPSLDEGMPMILLETAATGTPIVATPVGDIPTLVRDGATGLVVPRGDPAALPAALLRLRDEPGLGARLGAAARDEVRREHSSETMAARYAEVYSQHVRQ
ncbi:MAG: glycosyltransferase [bacterium]|nr:glycosyltransferase [bacterium]